MRGFNPDQIKAGAQKRRPSRWDGRSEGTKGGRLFGRRRMRLPRPSLLLGRAAGDRPQRAAPFCALAQPGLRLKPETGLLLRPAVQLLLC